MLCMRGAAAHDPSAAGAAKTLPARTPLNVEHARLDALSEVDSAQPETPQAATTLLEVLAWHVRAHPEQTQVVVLQDDSEQTIIFGQLATASAAVAAGL